MIEESKERVNRTQQARLGKTPPNLSPAEKKALLEAFHPDYRKEAYRNIRFGSNAGERTVHELADLLEGESPVADLSDERLRSPDRETDLLIIGGGGAGSTAALIAREAGVDVLMATKLRLGDSNTVMAEGGMQVAVSENDSPVQHFIDTFRGGQMKNDPILLRTLVEEGPSAAKWLMELGVLFDRDPDGNLSVRAGGGSTKARLLRCRDYTGLEIMRVLKEAVLNAGIEVLEFSPVVELLSAEESTSPPSCAGAVLKNLDTDRLIVVSAKCVILATGGIGRLHIQGFPTSNHFGATADGLPLAYRLGAPLTLQDTFQYHPTGAIFPESMAGILVTEGIRAAGGQLVNAAGERFVDEVDTRDVVAAAVIRECAEGRGVTTPAGRKGVWLDMPMVDLINGPGTLEQKFPNMVRQFSRFSIDIKKEPVLVYPTLHYQNGGVKIDVDGESGVKNLFVAGEASGGIHGRNRLMGNSLLDIIVYGRRAGSATARRCREISRKTALLTHLKRFARQRQEANVPAGGKVSPLLFPDYVSAEQRKGS